MVDRQIPSLPNLPPAPRDTESLLSWAQALNRAISELYRQLAEPIGGLLPSAPFVSLQAATPGTAQTGNFNIDGVGIATSFIGPLTGTASGNVAKQAATPGVQETGHLNISGTGIFGGDLIPNGNLTGAASLVASKLDLGTRSMSTTPTAGQIGNRVGLSLIGTGRFGLDNDNRGSLAIISLTGNTGWSDGLKIVHTNTLAGTDSAGLRIDTSVTNGAGGAGVQVINDGDGDAIYLAARGPTAGGGMTVGAGIDVNRSAVSPFTGERTANHAGYAGIAIDNFSSTAPAPYGALCYSGRNMSTTYDFPVFSGVSDGVVFQTAPWTTPTVDTAGNPAYRVMDSSGVGTPKAVLTHGGWIGVGISPPTAPLHISSGTSSQIKIRHNAAGGVAQIVFESSGASARGAVGFDNSTDKLYLGNASAVVLTWDQVGRVSLAGTVGFNRQGITLANGDNNNVAHANTFLRVTGPTAAFALTGFVAGGDGDVLYLYNSVFQTMTVKNLNAGSAIGNRILTLTGADVVLRATANSFVSLIYDTGVGAWILMSFN